MKAFDRVVLMACLVMLVAVLFSVQTLDKKDTGTEDKESYSIAVNYNQTLEAMIASGNYDWHSYEINDKNFNVNGTGDVVAIIPKLVHLNKDISSEDILSYLEEHELRPANLAELLAFGAIYPGIQQEFPIVALASSWFNYYGLKYVPALTSDENNKRTLNLIFFDGTWSEHYRFLAVRKQAMP